MTVRTIHFPPGATRSKVLIIAPQHTPPRQLLDAQGTVEVPAGAHVMLRLDGDELGVLSLLKPGDFTSLMVENAGPGIAEALEPFHLGTVGLHGSYRPGAIAELSGLDELTGIELHGSELDGESAEALAGMSRLRSLKLDGGASVAGAAAACRLTDLAALVLTGPVAFCAGLDRLSDLTKLQTLVLHSPDVDDSVFGRVMGMAALEHLTLGGGGITGRGIELLAQLPRLARLTIASPSFEIDALTGLTGSPVLSRLSLNGIPGIDDQVAPLLAALSPPLREVAIMAAREEEHPFSLSARVWLARTRPELSVNDGFLSEKAIARYVAAGLGGDPRSGDTGLVS